MTPEEFKRKWTDAGDVLSPIAGGSLEELGLKTGTKAFLINAGLPIDAAPFLSFVTDTDDLIYGINKLVKQYDFLESEFEKYVVIGSCSDGDPIAINTENNDQVEWLDHDDYFSAKFFNSSIEAMAACLLAYREFVETVQQENGEDAFLDANFTDEQFEGLIQKLRQADERAVSEAGFWKEQLEMDLQAREHFRSTNP